MPPRRCHLSEADQILGFRERHKRTERACQSLTPSQARKVPAPCRVIPVAGNFSTSSLGSAGRTNLAEGTAT